MTSRSDAPYSLFLPASTSSHAGTSKKQFLPTFSFFLMSEPSTETTSDKAVAQGSPATREKGRAEPCPGASCIEILSQNATINVTLLLSWAFPSPNMSPSQAAISGPGTTPCSRSPRNASSRFLAFEQSQPLEASALPVDVCVVTSVSPPPPYFPDRLTTVLAQGLRTPPLPSSSLSKCN